MCDGRVIKPVTYFDADPELTIEEDRRVRTPILQDTTNTQTNTMRKILKDTKKLDE